MAEPRVVVQTIAWAIGFGVITGTIAKKKGRSFGGYSAFGVLMFLVALPWVLLMKPVKAEQKTDQGLPEG